MDSSIVVMLIAGVMATYAAKMLFVYFRMRGARIVVCPETRQPAVVSVDAGHSAVGAAFNSPDLRLEICSRWPEREGCNQACASQIAVEPRATLAGERVKAWLSDKPCARCGRNAGEEWHAVGPQPGLLSPVTNQTTRWDDIPTRDLPGRLETDTPVCKHCQLFEDFRRQYPDEVVDRHRAAVN